MTTLTRVLSRPLGPAASWIAVALLAALLVPLMARGDAAQLLLAVLGGIAAVWIVHNPFVGVVIVFAGWFVRVTAVSYATLGLLLLPLAAAVIRDRRVRALDALQIRTLLAIGGLYLLSTWWNEFFNPPPQLAATDETTTQLAIFAMRLLFIVYVFYFVTTPRRVAGLAWLVIALMVAAAATALPPFLTGAGFRRAHAEFGLAENANRLAHVCLFATSLLWFYRCHGGDRRLKLLTLPLLGLLPLTALATASRSGFLQLLLLGFLALREQHGWAPARRMRSMVVLGAVTLVVVALVPTAQLMRATTFDPSRVAKGQDSLKNRYNTVVAALEAASGNPLLGIGIGNFRAVKRTQAGLPRKESTHNSYLWALLAGGVGVLGLYLVLFVGTWRLLRHLERWGPPELLWLAKGLRVNLSLFLVFSMFADFWLSEIFVAMVALPLALGVVATRRAADAPLPSPAVAR